MNRLTSFINEVTAAFEFDNLTDHEIAQLRSAVWFRILYGYGAVLRLADRIVAVSTRFWWPVMQDGVRVGSVIVIPYSTSSVIAAIDHAAVPDRARAMQIIDGVSADVYDCLYNGITLGAFQRVEGLFRGLCVMGDGRQDFEQVKPTIEAIDKIVKSSCKVIQRFGQPHLQVPAGLVQ